MESCVARSSHWHASRCGPANRCLALSLRQCGRLRRAPVELQGRNILTKRPRGRDVNDEDVFGFNDEFTSKQVKVRIGTISAQKETEAERAKTQQEVDQDRSGAIDSAIVRVMKSRRILTHNELVAEAREWGGRRAPPFGPGERGPVRFRRIWCSAALCPPLSRAGDPPAPVLLHAKDPGDQVEDRKADRHRVPQAGRPGQQDLPLRRLRAAPPWVWFRAARQLAQDYSTAGRGDDGTGFS